ncbi:cytochrome aa3 quinol oxidase subunit IV [Pullulanibacillus sp. KACC 23026]|uniref:cytochrome aa3 quinol oxidase subunit IV n=1 Tax=Pullulanibacillus sp. KACC 23026 TaxID=3028315 RepID=UPI0023B04187|nr:cytochrome aa3 quinol oxidase subunit IV [Pullulanibacillus sp. KACC 23026]WEG13037.1 cytochrome aa3 quinol oxidase subunit IV [Pullulanibacillus sp. KACC 23026]
MEKNQTAHSNSHHGFPWSHVIGFILSLVLTVAALWIALSLNLSATSTMVLIIILAIFQVFVQLLMFMHLREQEGAFQITAISFGFFVAIAVVAGSIWIMEYGLY